MSGGGYSGREPVKIVIISTQYVETDATSFKSVVQKLTGKDSDAAEAAAGKAVSQRKVGRDNIEKNVRGAGSSFLMRDMSFKEFDRLLTEMPSINDLWSDD